MIFLTTIILLFVFTSNLIVYWVLFLKVKNKQNKLVRLFYKLFPIIWTLSLVPIPIINSSFLIMVFPQNLSYFRDYWIFFVLLGIVFIILGINFANKARKVYRAKPLDENSSKLITSGVFRIMRHPIYSAWVIIFLGAAIISDSIISLMISPIILLILEVHARIEEKLILIPKYGELYEKYKEKTPYRIIPTPLNFLLIIITFIIIYVGILNII